MRRVWQTLLTEYLALTDRWHHHPGVRSHHELTSGERAADRMRRGMGSWSFVFVALAFLAVWMLLNHDNGWDPYPFILLNLVLSCVAALQGAILLIAGNRAEAVSAELAQHDYTINRDTKLLVQRQAQEITELKRLLQQVTAGHQQIMAELHGPTPPGERRS